MTGTDFFMRYKTVFDIFSLIIIHVQCSHLFFFLKRYPNRGDGSETDKNENQKLYYHRVGELQEKDVLVAEFPEYPSRRMWVPAH